MTDKITKQPISKGKKQKKVAVKVPYSLNAIRSAMHERGMSSKEDKK